MAQQGTTIDGEEDPWSPQGAVHLSSDTPQVLARPSGGTGGGMRGQFASAAGGFLQIVPAMLDDFEISDPFWSRNAPEDEVFDTKRNLLVFCCPFLSGNPLSAVRKADYKRMLRSMTFWLSVFQVLYFVVSLFPHGFASPLSNPMFGPPAKSLVLLGGKDVSMILAGHVYRFVSPVLLHAGLFHLLYNILVQFRLGLAYESKWGLEQYFVICLASVMGGVCVSLVISSSVACASSAATCGIIGARVGEIILEWRVTDVRQRVANIVTMLLLLLGFVILGFFPFVGNGGHFGALVAGVVLGFMFFVPKRTENESVREITMFVCLVTMIFFFGFSICLFYGFRGVDL